jgi:hypothetical protein
LEKRLEKGDRSIFLASRFFDATFDTLIARMERAENEALSEKRLVEHQLTNSTTLSFS